MVGYPEALNVVVVDWIGWIGDVYTDVVGSVYGIVVYDEPDMVAVAVMMAINPTSVHLSHRRARRNLVRRLQYAKKLQ